MTVMHIAIPDDLKDAFEKAYPGETIEQAVERLLRAEVEKHQSTPPSNRASLVEMARRIREGTQPTSDDEIRAQDPAEVMESFRRLRENSPPTSDEEIRRLRHEGRP